ncbi:MAG: hypothetical protein NC344_07780 [Bacteroidales bacterium]|nr:hypothetical protein [Bacteroidales bacterium]MCM1147713.1 hypothetical protein [Bacteroidales bacterium]MCM1206758.1 hypothetical protein [Bacillota bacterium]MCM1510658.1 hypothetical protein [Clostridium sp.]
MKSWKSYMQKIISYLGEAARLYEALPWQQSRCRAEMIQKLIKKLKAK